MASPAADKDRPMGLRLYVWCAVGLHLRGRWLDLGPAMAGELDHAPWRPSSRAGRWTRASRCSSPNRGLPPPRAQGSTQAAPGPSPNQNAGRGRNGSKLEGGCDRYAGSHRSSVPAVSLRIASAVPPRPQRLGSGHFGDGRFLTGNIGRLRILGQTRGHLVGGLGKRRLSRQKVRFRSPQVIE